MANSSQNQQFMRQAINQAQTAIEDGDVPVGAIIVRKGAVIGQAHNQVELLKDPTAHAEMIAITQAAGAIGDWRLLETALYVTKEPCPMCAGAINLARIPLVIFGAPDQENAGIITCSEVIRGVLEDECRLLLQNFFQDLRKKD